MFIISHRGAAGLAPENTLQSITAAKKLNVDAIEIDVRATRDKQLILCHDASLLRITNKNEKVSDLSLKQIQAKKTISGQRIPSLDEALKTAGTHKLVIEGKGGDWAESLAEFLSSKSLPSKPMIISDNHRELVLFSTLAPKFETYAISWTHPFDSLFLARQTKLTGVSLHYAHYNPLTYHFAKRAGLKMIMSPVPKTWLAKFLHRLYPKVMITTDYPDKLID
jgi:glycerophosphoryl diester phosphodiesterase